ncbi:unnamed protein product [Lactuca virosa]|uniref:Morc S5 domain-containing protein n=1 Tax=Lactuca virosa TaxID=75947 RepID=A0AAU9LU81_9ASTR|nr:unnamed protein product [Lactuca virosa]
MPVTLLQFHHCSLCRSTEFLRAAFFSLYLFVDRVYLPADASATFWPFLFFHRPLLHNFILFDSICMPHLNTYCNKEDMVEAGWDYNHGEVDAGLVKMESNSIRTTNGQAEYLHTKSNAYGRIPESEGNRSRSASSTGQSGTCILDHEKSHVDDTSPCSTSSTCAAPICRQFWKAGAYNEDLTPVTKTHAGSSYLHIHPKFLHSNATSHKWAFGAIAELLDNAVDEIQKGATCVYIDKTLNPRNGSPALLIQDDGTGMDPEAMRQCLSFGFSDKKSDSAIGKYGNGFKTSSMRLGADAIVFSRNFVGSFEECLKGNGSLTQSIGLLSYTFLTQSGYDRIVVPMVHYEFNFKTHVFQSRQHSDSNLSVLLKWSPYSTEEQLLKQFDNVGPHGTKVVIYNLWLDNEGNVELDFESDPEDIRIEWDGKSKAKDDSLKAKNENHIANRLKYSLRAYLSILYVNLPETFCIVLRGKVVLYDNIATDLKHPEFIEYKPHSGEGKVLTTIGFLKEAPDVNVHGFNIYHKGRLILPFYPVVTFSRNRGRGVVGVLEANFIEPTHSKQDFEKTNVFQKLVTRLKDMTHEYWDVHCSLIGYQVPKKLRSSSLPPPTPNSAHFTQTPPPSHSRKSTITANHTGGSKSAPVITTVSSRAALYAKSPPNPNPNPIIEEPPAVPQAAEEGGSGLKRKLPEGEGSHLKKHMREADQPDSNMPNTAQSQRCLKSEKAGEELNLKVMNLKIALGEAQKEYAALLAELMVFENVNVNSSRSGYLYM